MKIFYGISNKYIDVTQYCLSNLTKDNIITICWGDEQRGKMFTDPFINVVKKIFIVNNNQLTEYDHNMKNYQNKKWQLDIYLGMKKFSKSVEI